MNQKIETRVAYVDFTDGESKIYPAVMNIRNDESWMVLEFEKSYIAIPIRSIKKIEFVSEGDE